MKEETFLMRRPSLYRIQAKNAVINGWFLIFESIFTNLKSHRARTHFRYKGFLSSQVAIVIMKILKFQIMSKMTYEAVKHANWWKMKNSVSFIW